MTWQSKTHEREEKILKASALYCQGKPQTAIAREVGVTQGQISRYLKVLEQRWLESSLVNFDEARARELAKWDNLEREYWEAWQRSIGTRTVVTTEDKEGAESYSKTATRKERLAGDPRFLDGVRGCIEQRGKLLGLYAPIKQDLVIHDFSDWTDEQLEGAIVKEAELITGRAAAAGTSEGGGPSA